MRTTRLEGGPEDGREIPFDSTLRVMVGFEYGWTYRCGALAYSSGHYTEGGTWVEPEFARTLDYVCDLCERYGVHDITSTEGEGR